MFGRRRKRGEPKQPRERKPREERLFPRIFRFIATGFIEGTLTRFIGLPSTTQLSGGKKIGILAALAAGGVAIWKGCG